jgi:hypothetical protein
MNARDVVQPTDLKVYLPRWSTGRSCKEVVMRSVDNFLNQFECLSLRY